MQEEFYKRKDLLLKSLAGIIKLHRKNNKKSISLISNEIGMTKSMWADTEKSIKDPQLSTLWRIAEGLELPLSTVILELENNLGDNFSLIETE